MKDFMKSFILGCIVTVVLWSVLTPASSSQMFSKLTSWYNNNDDQKMLYLGRANDSLGLDPATETDHQSFKVTVNIYDTLVKHSSDGATILPSLATDWSTDESGLVWTFDIRNNVEFHDGSKLDAHAIKFNFDRWMDEENPYHAGNFNYWVVNFEGIIKEVNALTDYKLEIRLDKAFAPFLGTLTQPAFAIASPDAIKTFNDSLDTHPIGTGPFIFDEWKDHTITLRRNDDYWGDVAHINGVVFETISNADERLTRLQSGKLHIAELNYFDTLEETLLKDNLSHVPRPSFNIGYISLNMENEYLKHTEVRKAIAHAFDRDLMLNRAFNETSKNANTFIPPVLWGHNETIVSQTFDPSLSESLLEPFIHDDRIELNLLVMDAPRTYFPAPIELGQYIKESLQPIGIDVKLRIEPWKEVIKLRDSGDYDMVLAGWNGDIVDPDNFLFTMFKASDQEEILSQNYSNYSNPTVNKLLMQARQTLDQTFRISLYREIQEIIHEDIPAIPLAHTTPITIIQGITGYQPYLSGADILNTVDWEEDYD